MVSQDRPQMHVRLKAPAKIPWSSRIALKHHHPRNEDGAVLLGLYAVLGPGDLNRVPAHPTRSRAIATDAAVEAVEAVEAVVGNEVVLAGL